MTVAELLNLSVEEILWLENRKTGDLTPRQHLLVSEIQTRAYLLTTMVDGPARAALLAECLALKAEMDQVSGDTTMRQINDLAQRHMDLHQRVVDAAR